MIQFTNINPTLESASGEAYYFTYNDHEYLIEVWANENGSGEDIYDANSHFGAATPFETEADEAEFAEKLDQIKKAWAQAHADLVFPATQAAVARAVAEVEGPPLDTESSASRQHYVDTGRYLHQNPENNTLIRVKAADLLQDPGDRETVDLLVVSADAGIAQIADTGQLTQVNWDAIKWEVVNE